MLVPLGMFIHSICSTLKSFVKLDAMYRTGTLLSHDITQSLPGFLGHYASNLRRSQIVSPRRKGAFFIDIVLLHFVQLLRRVRIAENCPFRCNVSILKQRSSQGNTLRVGIFMSCPSVSPLLLCLPYIAFSIWKGETVHIAVVLGEVLLNNTSFFRIHCCSFVCYMEEHSGKCGRTSCSLIRCCSVNRKTMLYWHPVSDSNRRSLI